MTLKEILTTKRQISFYSDCYKKVGYELIDVEKVDNNYIMRLEDTILSKTSKQQAILHGMEKKLRVIEIADRQKHRYNFLHLNLSLQIVLFIIQAFIFYRLHYEQAHPQTMLQVGVILAMLFLLGTFVIKMKELFGWNRTIQEAKENLYEPYKKAADNGTYTISVLFTRSHSFPVSEIIYWCTGRAYTHASIGLGDQLEEFYSYTFKGFKTEHPAHRKIHGNHKNSLCYQFKVTEQEYRKIQANIHAFKEVSSHYNLIGVIISSLHIYLPFKKKHDYFCSEFVAEQLRCIDSFHLKREAKMYLPTNLAKALIMQDNLYSVKVNEV